MSEFKLSAFADEADEALSGQISALKENGIEYLEIRGVNGQNISKITTSECREIHKLLESQGIQVWSIGSPIGKIKITDDFAPHLEEFKHLLELADILKATRFRLFSFYECQGDSARDEVLYRLQKLAETAKGSGVLLCHENEKDIYGEMALECLDIHKNIPEIKAIFDPANFVQAGQDTKEAWALLHPYVEYLHIKDSKKSGQVVPAGQGDGEIPYILEKYKALGGSVLTLEPHLSEFVGLGELEHGQTLERMLSYPSQRAAFDSAVNALKALI